MARRILLWSAAFCLVFIGLSQVPDPKVFGIHEEPARILFYGGSGLLAGFSGFVAAGTGLYLAARKRWH